MSRIGRKPIPVPGNVTITIDGSTVKVKGPKGELGYELVGDVTVEALQRLPLREHQQHEQGERHRDHDGRERTQGQPGRQAAPLRAGVESSQHGAVVPCPPPRHARAVT